MASLAAAGPPATLRRRCLQVVAWALLKRRVQAGGCGGSSASSLEEGVRALPQELQLELLLLAASWQLLDDAACTLLTCGAADSGSSSSSILAGAATVSLAHCVLLGGASLRRLFCCPLPQLQTLSLRGLPQLTDAHVALVAKQCPSLTRLDFSKCLELTGAAVAAVAAGACAPQLQALSLVGCWQVAALPGLALRCTGLASLDVSGCWQLAEGELQETLAALPLLEELNLSGCKHLGAGVFISASLPPSLAAAQAAEQRHAQQLRALGAAAAAQQQQEEGQEDAPDVSIDCLGQFPVDGVALSNLRSLDLSGTQANDCLLLWLAQRGCGRLQKLVLGNTPVTGRGLAALLLAKRALLHHAWSGRSSASHSSAGAPDAQAAAAGAGAEVLPLLELGVAGTPACGAAEEGSYVPRHWAAAVMGSWEEPLGGGLPVHLPCASSGGSGSGGRSSGQRACLIISLLAPPADSADTHPVWPPDSPAEALAALGPLGLAQLQALDAGGAAGVGALTEVLAAHCSSLQRLRLPGCTSLSDSSLEAVLAAAPQLRELDVSGCTGVRVSRPGSRFLRHKAARLQEGGVTDASLRLLSQPQWGQQQQQQQQQPQQQLSQRRNDRAAAAPAAPAAAAAPTAQAAAPAGLQSLRAGGLSLTDGTLATLPATLSSLSLRGCKRVSDSGLLQLLMHCPSLARLDASGCSQLTAGAFGSHTPLEAQQGSSSGALGGGGNGATSGESSQPATSEQEAEHLQAFRRVVSTACAVRLQRAALPKQACTREVLAWLAGQAGSSSGSSGKGDASNSTSSGDNPPGRSALQRLEAASCALLDEADLFALAACCPQLKSLQLTAAGAAAGSRLCAALAQRCRLLSSLSLWGAAGVGDAEVVLLLRELPGLQQLDLSGCGGVTGAAFIEWLQLAAAAERPGAAAAGRGSARAAGTAAEAAAVAAQGAAERRPGRTGLRVLKLEGCPVDDAAAVAIVGTCPHLEVLSLRQCTRLTSAAAAALLWCGRNLRQLLLGGTHAGDLFQPPGAMPPGFAAAAAAAGVLCAEGLTPVEALLAGQVGSAQPSPLSLVELPSDSRTVRQSADWPAVGILGRPRVQLA